MPLNGDKVDELLSGYLDGCLSPAESAELELALQDAAVRQRYEELVSLRQELRELRDSNSKSAPGLSPAFATSVWERIQAEKSALANANSASHSNDQQNDSITSRRGRRNWLTFASLAATAAAVVFLLTWPNWSNQNREHDIAKSGNNTSQNDELSSDELSTGTGSLATNSDNDETSADEVVANPFGATSVADASTNQNNGDVGTADESADVHLADSPWQQQLMITVVADIRLSKEAVRQDYVAKAFSAHGIIAEPPVLADEEMLAVLSESRMAAQPGAVKGEALMYFVHADTLAIDRFLQEFLLDKTNITDMRTDVAFDTPINELMKSIVAKAGSRFSIERSFAAQIGDAESDGERALLEIGPQGKLVSNSARDAKSPATDPGNGGGLGVGGMSTILLLVRLPQ